MLIGQPQISPHALLAPSYSPRPQLQMFSHKNYSLVLYSFGSQHPTAIAKPPLGELLHYPVGNPQFIYSATSGTLFLLLRFVGVFSSRQFLFCFVLFCVIIFVSCAAVRPPDQDSAGGEPQPAASAGEGRGDTGAEPKCQQEEERGGIHATTGQSKSVPVSSRGNGVGWIFSTGAFGGGLP